MFMLTRVGSLTKTETRVGVSGVKLRAHRYLERCSTPLRHNAIMKVSISLEPDIYALAKLLAKADDISLSAVINQKLRDSFFSVQDSSFVKNGLLVSRSKILVTRAMVQQALENE